MADKPARTNRGTFTPGTSGNPSGKSKPRTDAADAPVARRDGWQNFFSGHGVYGRDKRQGTSFKAATLTFDQLAELWRGDDLAARAVETLPKESLREGYDLSIPEAAQGGEDEAERIAEIVDALSTLGADEVIRTGLCYERGLGGGAVLIGANDGQDDLTKPLRLESIRSLDWLTPLEPREIMPVYGYADPRAPKYGQPEIYRITSRTILPPQDGKYGNQVMDIHESRLLVFPGIRVSRYQYMASQGGWGDSVLIRMWRVLRDFNLAWGSAGALVTEFASATYKMKDLWQALSTKGGAAAFAERLQAMDLARSTINATVIDGEDDFKREQTPISGLPDLMDKFSTRLAAAADMPLTLLFGTSPAGLNATGESDIRFFYDRVAAYQRDKVMPQLKTLIRILFRTMGSKVEPEKWDIEFRPLWQESAADKAKAMLTQAQADHIWVTDGMLSAEEVADAHWGTGKWVPDLRVDFEARERQEAAAAAPVTQADFAAMGRGPNGEMLQPAPGQRQLTPGPAQFGRPQPPQPGFGQPLQRQLQPGPPMPGQQPGAKPAPGQPGQAPAAPGAKPGGSKLGASGYRYAPDVTQRGQGADDDLDRKPRSMVLSNDSADRQQLSVVREDDFSPDEARDENGKWTGGGSGASAGKAAHALGLKPEAGGQLEDNARWYAGKTEGEREHLLLEGNIGIPRAKMPQIDDKDVPAFFEKLKAEGVTVHPHEMVPAASLKPTQNEMNMAKVESMVQHWNPALAKPIIISNDGHILDGHHRWAAQLGANPRAIIPVREVDMPIRKLLAEANAFPPTHHEGVQLVKDRMDYSPDQPRAQDGKFGEGGAGAGGDEDFSKAVHAWTHHQMTSEQFKALAARKGAENAEHERNVKAFEAKLQPDEKAACTNYSVFAEAVNGALRSGQPPTSPIEKHALSVLDSAIRKSAAPTDMVVFRGIHSAQDPLTHLKPGVVIQDKGYVSTTSSRDIASEFAHQEHTGKLDPSSTRVIVRIKVPRGHAAAPIPSTYKFEHEYVLPRGSKFKINSVAKEGADTVVDAEAL